MFLNINVFAASRLSPSCWKACVEVWKCDPETPSITGSVKLDSHGLPRPSAALKFDASPFST